MTTRYDVLPAAQRRLLPEFSGLASAGFVLYGGTAVALHLGHRRSFDFDFFSADALDEARLLEAAPVLASSVPLQRVAETWTVLVRAPSRSSRPVKVSFFGGLRVGRVGRPETTDGGELLVASRLDLLGHKLKVLLQRIEAKDYRDIAALLRAGERLEAGLGAASALFGSTFPQADALRALTFFNGGDLDRLPKRDRGTLVSTVAAAGDALPTPIAARSLA